MHDPAAATASQTVIAFTRLLGAVDALSSAIAGFALLAGARAFTFAALLGWREPVLGGAGLVLLAVVGWLRWQWGGVAALPVMQNDRQTINHRNTVCGRRRLPSTEHRDVACYNRSTECDAKRWFALVERQLFRPYSTVGVSRSRDDRVVLPGPGVQTRAPGRQSDYKETPC